MASDALAQVKQTVNDFVEQLPPWARYGEWLKMSGLGKV